MTCRITWKQQKPSYWSWLAQAYGIQGPLDTVFMVNVTRTLAIFLLIAIAVEILIVIYVYPRKNKFAQESLNAIG